MPKRIILLLDGTWNDADTGSADSNIVRLREIIAACLDPDPTRSEMITPASGSHQASIISRTFTTYDGRKTEYLIFYERGVGTGGFLDVLSGGAFGVGLARNIRRAYIFLSRHYHPDDEIFVFGFSRGSYTARSLVGYLGAVGLLRRELCSPPNESRAWSYYRTSPPDRLPTIEAELQGQVHDQPNLRIKCLGVFDTVGALGVPVQTFRLENRDLYEFHDVALSAKTDVNLHALAIDEHREAFEATVWRQPKFAQFSSIVEQVWFPGAHSDVGGGYVEEETREKGDVRSIDDITLDWMLKRLLQYYPDFPVRRGNDPAWPQIDPTWALARQHEPRRRFYRVRPFAVRSIGNCRITTRRWCFEINVCHDRHANPVGEMVHISAIERLGCRISIDGKMGIYAPRNLVAALNLLDKESITNDDYGIKCVDWSGESLSRAQARCAIDLAYQRLNRCP